MTSAQKKIAPKQDLVMSAKRELEKFCNDVAENTWTYTEEAQASANLLEGIFTKLEDAHKDYFRLLREAREKRASEALKQKLKSELKARLREELKAELRAGIMDELKAEGKAEVELEI